ncbi:hypothetical protein OSSY52_22080 [Tepiditoga spiralis]|uniref:Cation:proton antiporter n=1 Tax=Tepiditoga spiralis TaxID=2108365 RepID=A0A7G1GAD4_9BACT|nr:cation:proton antiporter subunit C [Tepiditoga spiralis]BBE32067.1 hypothetical protein OSSY52_22080 [Tepiditoga spiralis]
MLTYELFSIFICFIGLSGVILKKDIILKLMNLGVFQGGVVLFFVSLAYKGKAPMITEGVTKYSDPLIHSFLLTVVVIGFANLALILVFSMILSNKLKTYRIDELEKKINKGR